MDYRFIWKPQDDIWHNAYHVTGELVKMLHDEVKKDHAHFLVFLACLTPRGT